MTHKPWCLVDKPDCGPQHCTCDRNPLARTVSETLEEAQPYLDAALRAVAELKRSPFSRCEGAGDDKMEPELCADVIEDNLCALDHMLEVARSRSLEVE